MQRQTMRKTIKDLTSKLKQPKNRLNGLHLMDELLLDIVKGAKPPYKALKTCEFAYLSTLRDAYWIRTQSIGDDFIRLALLVRALEKFTDIANPEQQFPRWPYIWEEDIKQVSGKDTFPHCFCNHSPLALRTPFYYTLSSHSSNDALLPHVLDSLQKAHEMYRPSGIRFTFSRAGQKGWAAFAETPDVQEITDIMRNQDFPHTLNNSSLTIENGNLECSIVPGGVASRKSGRISGSFILPGVIGKYIVSGLYGRLEPHIRPTETLERVV